MKRRILFISLALALLVVFMLPAAASAKGDFGKVKRPSLTDFNGGGFIYVSAMPPPTVNGNIWRFSGEEVVSGAPMVADWDLLNGAIFTSIHSSVVFVNSAYDCRGFMWGTFAITNPSGDTLSGVFQGKIKGNLDFYYGLPWVSDSGTWYATSGTGDFAGTRAWGKWSANLDAVQFPGTLSGNMIWQGKYLTR